MAGEGSAQERLDKIAGIIATDLVAEVCSIYVLRAGEVLELFTATGLKPTAVHNTRLQMGEGLVGTIAANARPMALSDAQSHPKFAYRPETGEEIYHSLMGVPILRGGRVQGVLAVQNRTQRHYTDEEAETLETVAMVIAELIAAGELISAEELHAVEGASLLPVTIAGVRLNAGVAMGEAVLHEPRFVIEELVSDNPEEEQQRLKEAVDEMHGAIDAMLQATDVANGGEHRDILETYRMFAEDAGWLARIGEAIDSGLTAEAAVEKVPQRHPRPVPESAGPLFARAAARPRGPRQSPAPASDRNRGRRHRRRMGAPRKYHPCRPQHGSGTASRL